MTEPVADTPVARLDRAFARFMAFCLGLLLLALAVVTATGIAVLVVLGRLERLGTTNCRGVAILEAATAPDAQRAGAAGQGQAVAGIIGGVNSHIDAVHGIPTTTVPPAPATTTTTFVLHPNFKRCK